MAVPCRELLVMPLTGGGFKKRESAGQPVAELAIRTIEATLGWAREKLARATARVVTISLIGDCNDYWHVRHGIGDKATSQRAVKTRELVQFCQALYGWVERNRLSKRDMDVQLDSQTAKWYEMDKEDDDGIDVD